MIAGPAARNGAQLQELRDTISDAFDLDGLAQLVKFELGVSLGSIVPLPSSLNDVAFNLIMYTEQRGQTNELVMAVFRSRPKNDRVVAYCRTHAMFVFEPELTSEALARRISSGITTMARVASQSSESGMSVRHIIGNFRQDLQSVRTNVELLEKYKVLHDHLHTIDFQLFGVVERTTARFRSNDDELVTLNDYTGRLDDLMRESEAIARGLPTSQVEEGWIGNLRRAVGCLREAIERREGTPERRAVSLLKGVLAREPSRINGQLMVRATELQGPLRQLMEALEGVRAALVDAAIALPVAEGLAGLERLWRRLLAMTVEHDFWQRIDNQLRLAADTASDSMEELHFLWPEIAEAAAQLCSVRPESPWAVDLKSAMAKFEAAGSVRPENTALEQKFAFNDFRRISRKRFFEVDTELRRLCGSLVLIAEPLRTLLEALDHGGN